MNIYLFTDISQLTLTFYISKRDLFCNSYTTAEYWNSAIAWPTKWNKTCFLSGFAANPVLKMMKPQNSIWDILINVIEFLHS